MFVRVVINFANYLKSMHILEILCNLLNALCRMIWAEEIRDTSGISVVIKSSVKSTLTVNLNLQWDIAKVKRVIAPKLGLEPEEIKIIFAGKELGNSVVISECDLGQQSVLHAIKIRYALDRISSRVAPKPSTSVGTALLRDSIPKSQANFFVYCATCRSLEPGKLRVRCHLCKSGAFTVHADPQSWNDVLVPKRITGNCENELENCAEILNNREPIWAEFFFKCASHITTDEWDGAVPLPLLRHNWNEVLCLACGDVADIVLVFSCKDGHVTCLPCFVTYCNVRLKERQFYSHESFGYTLPCPVNCPDSYIEETHHFRVLKEDDYARYQRFAAEEFVLQSGGVLCPQPGCGMGIICDEGCNRVACVSGCGYVFCRKCLQGFHVGPCERQDDANATIDTALDFNIDPERVAQSRWDEASKIAIRVTTKPCPKCRTPTERSGGCMHMECSRAGCNFHWCWVCQDTWSRQCMGDHWFG